jgi:predicted phage-related endonuclease
MPNAPHVSDKTYGEIRTKTLMAHETASLFETVAEISNTDADENEEHLDENGQPINAFASPLSLWEMKTGRYTTTPPKSRSLWSRMKWGVIDSAADKEGFETRRPEGTYIHGSNKIMSCRPDVEVSEDGVNWYPMIAKNIASTMSEMWRNAAGSWTPPEHMVIEGSHHMAITGAERFYIAALFGGVTERLFVIHRDEGLIEDIVGAAEDFWNCVTDDRRPKSSGARDADVLARINLHIDPDEPVVDKRNDSDFLRALEEKETLGKEKGKIEKRIKELTAYLNEHMQGVSSAITADGRQLKWIRVEGKEVSFTRKPSAHLRSAKITEKSAGTKIEELVK